jgi:hypothetical protein
MSDYNFIPGQRVQIAQPHNHLPADETLYTVGAIDRISGIINVQLLKEGAAVGAVPQSKLKAK